MYVCDTLIRIFVSSSIYGTGVIFRISVVTGRDIGRYSYFPSESEVCSPSQSSFWVQWIVVHIVVVAVVVVVVAVAMLGFKLENRNERRFHCVFLLWLADFVYRCLAMFMYVPV